MKIDLKTVITLIVITAGTVAYAHSVFAEKKSVEKLTDMVWGIYKHHKLDKAKK